MATYVQITERLSRRALQRALEFGQVVRIWHGIYCLPNPSTMDRLRGLDLRCGAEVAACSHTAAALYGFDVEEVSDLHILNPPGHFLRTGPGLIMHRYDEVPLVRHRTRRLTAPDWTAIDVARHLTRPRALAVLDAAIRSRFCDLESLTRAAEGQSRRTGIAQVRALVPLARGGAESPMESEARLAMLDGGLPEPDLQYRIMDRSGLYWRVDFAWPRFKVAVEYDGFEHHSQPDDLRRERRKRAAIEGVGWRLLSIVANDVRVHPDEMVHRIRSAMQMPVRPNQFH